MGGLFYDSGTTRTSTTTTTTTTHAKPGGRLGILKHVLSMVVQVHIGAHSQVQRATPLHCIIHRTEKQHHLVVVASMALCTVPYLELIADRWTSPPRGKRPFQCDTSVGRTDLIGTIRTT